MRKMSIVLIGFEDKLCKKGEAEDEREREKIGLVRLWSKTEGIGVELRSDIRPDQEARLSSSVIKRINCEREGNKHLYVAGREVEGIYMVELPLFLCDLGGKVICWM